jgi:hypothetical protein
MLQFGWVWALYDVDTGQHGSSSMLLSGVIWLWSLYRVSY